MNLQDQLWVFQSMFPNQPKEHLMSMLRSLQTGKTPIYPEGQSSRKDTYPDFGGDPRHTSTQSPRASPSPLEYLTPIQTQSSRSVIPPTQGTPHPSDLLPPSNLCHPSHRHLRRVSLPWKPR